MITRFSLHNPGYPGMKVDFDHGEYVLYSDYISLQQKLDKADKLNSDYSWAETERIRTYVDPSRGWK